MARRVRGFMLLAAIVVFLSNLSPEVWGHLIREVAAFIGDNTRRAAEYLHSEA